MKKFLRFTSLVTLAAFLGLSAVESFHSHAARQTDANCAVCQVAHQTPALISRVPTLGFHRVSSRAAQASAPLPYVRYVLVSHGLSPPVL